MEKVWLPPAGTVAEVGEIELKGLEVDGNQVEFALSVEAHRLVTGVHRRVEAETRLGAIVISPELQPTGWSEGRGDEPDNEVAEKPEHAAEDQPVTDTDSGVRTGDGRVLD